MNEISARELFGNDTSYNLSKKSLTKSSKKERLEIVDSNLPFLVEFYFGRGQSKDRDYLSKVYELFTEPKFLKPLEKLVKADKKRRKKETPHIPEGLHVIAQDAANEVSKLFQRKLQNFNGSNKSEYGEAAIQSIKEQCDEILEQLNALVNELTKKETKRFIKMGIAEPYARMLSAAIVPSEYLSERNMRRYFNNLNRTLTNIVRKGIVKVDEDSDGYENHIGLNLALDDTILDIYGIFFRNVERDVFLAGLREFILEPRTPALDHFTRPQREMYNSLNRVVTEILEGNLIVNTIGDKLSKKKGKKKKAKMKELAVTKKELKKIMKAYGKKRLSDLRKGRDVARRIQISALDEETYPQLIKAFHKSAGNSLAAEEAEAAARKEQQRLQQQATAKKEVEKKEPPVKKPTPKAASTRKSTTK